MQNSKGIFLQNKKCRNGKGAQLVAQLVPVERADWDWTLLKWQHRGRLQVHNQAAQVVAMKRSLIRGLSADLACTLVPPHADSPATAIRLFLFVKSVLWRSCWWSCLEISAPCHGLHMWCCCCWWWWFCACELWPTMQHSSICSASRVRTRGSFWDPVFVTTMQHSTC